MNPTAVFPGDGLKKLKATGTRGSWFAQVQDRLLPCVHKHWVTWPTYCDPGVVPGTPKEDEYIAAIRNGTVVLTTDEIVSQDPFLFRRTGYVAIYKIVDIKAGTDGVSFRFVSRECELA